MDNDCDRSLCSDRLHGAHRAPTLTSTCSSSLKGFRAGDAHGCRRSTQSSARSPRRSPNCLADISHRLRKEREFAFYGDEDFIPTEEYTREDAQAALDDAWFTLALADAFPSQGSD